VRGLSRLLNLSGRGRRCHCPLRTTAHGAVGDPRPELPMSGHQVPPALRASGSPRDRAASDCVDTSRSLRIFRMAVAELETVVMLGRPFASP
jgi:hypothetical protein